MNKLNFGCGSRFNPGWTNIDFHSSDARVQRVNLLGGFPFPDNYYDVAYSSHVLEHFTREQGLFLLTEAHRVLKTGGILRIVVPDLEESCREYLRVLGMEDADPAKPQLYEWSIVELLDQLVRHERCGQMGPLQQKILHGGDARLIEYVRSRTESHLSVFAARAATKRPSIWNRLKRITRDSLATRVLYWRIKMVSKLIPKQIRSMVLLETGIGERHRWMYDRYGMAVLLGEAGFKNVRVLHFDESDIPQFNEEQLDRNADGTSYKNVSLYVEARK